MGNNGIILRGGGRVGNDGKRERNNHAEYGTKYDTPRASIIPSPQPPNHQATVKAVRKRPLRRREVLTTDLLWHKEW